MAWVRSGECCHCGECCKGDPFNGEQGAPAVAGYCPLYQLSEHGHCAGYGKHPYYLSGCNVWPDRPELIADKPSCTYSFEWRD
jgi:hypothetical protein